MELRMIHKVHRVDTFDLGSPPLDPYEAFEIATVNGARVCGFEGEAGALVSGMKADAVLVDLARVEREPWLDPRSDIVEAFVQRAMGEDVRTVVVGGKVLLEDGRLRSMDVDALFREVRALLREGASARASCARRSSRPDQAACAAVVQGMGGRHGERAVLRDEQPGLAGC